MPVHLNSITNKDGLEIFSWILQNQINECEDVYVTRDGLYILCSKDIFDVVSKEKIGEYVFTVKNNSKQKTCEVKDIDIVLVNPCVSKIKFDEKLENSSDANEYYNASIEEGGHFQLETVNRYLIEGEIEGLEQEVSLSAFPFKLSIYDTIEDFNSQMGFSKPVTVGETEIEVCGYSDTFISSSVLFKQDSDDEVFSFVVGKIKEYKKVCVEMNGEMNEFIIAQIKTAVGNLTTVINPDRYNIESIGVDKIVAMMADIKANFKTTDKYPKPERVSTSKNNAEEKKGFWSKIKKWVV